MIRTLFTCLPVYAALAAAALSVHAGKPAPAPTPPVRYSTVNIPLPDVAGVTTGFAEDLNDLGDVVVRYDVFGGYLYEYDADPNLCRLIDLHRTLADLGKFDETRYGVSRAFRINRNRQIAGQASDRSVPIPRPLLPYRIQAPFVDANGVTRDWSVEFYPQSFDGLAIIAINADGDILLQASANNDWNYYLWPGEPGSTLIEVAPLTAPSYDAGRGLSDRSNNWVSCVFDYACVRLDVNLVTQEVVEQPVGPTNVQRSVGGINTRGDIIGDARFSTKNSYRTAYVLLAGQSTLRNLGTLGGNSSEATGLNQSGDFIGWSDTSEKAFGGQIRSKFLYTNGAMWDLRKMIDGSPTSIDSINAINNGRYLCGKLTQGGLPCLFVPRATP
jgi:hypothetical protein